MIEHGLDFYPLTPCRHGVLESSIDNDVQAAVPAPAVNRHVWIDRDTGVLIPRCADLTQIARDRS